MNTNIYTNDAFTQSDEEFSRLDRLGDLELQLQSLGRGHDAERRRLRSRIRRLFATRGRGEF